jgi:hypothetical protein
VSWFLGAMPRRSRIGFSDLYRKFEGSVCRMQGISGIVILAEAKKNPFARDSPRQIWNIQY